ncbi:MAG: hypothetical protein AAGC91_01095 [Pseudomonadota bacterium]
MSNSATKIDEALVAIDPLEKSITSLRDTLVLASKLQVTEHQTCDQATDINRKTAQVHNETVRLALYRFLIDAITAINRAIELEMEMPPATSPRWRHRDHLEYLNNKLGDMLVAAFNDEQYAPYSNKLQDLRAQAQRLLRKSKT